MTIINHQGKLFRYRGREEFQDNDMAFKFTPTDEIWPVNDAASFYPPVANNAHSSRTSISFPAHSPTYPPASTMEPAKVENPQHYANHDVFNEHIKPDLVRSRLRFGPSALRSAIDASSGSPSKITQQAGLADMGHGLNTLGMDPPLFTSHGLGSSDSMNPSAAAFTPTSDFSNANIPMADPVNMSLARALAEKTAEVYAIKAELENERNRRVETENEVSRINMVNKSLASSIQMLGSIVKHNAQKHSSAPGESTKQCLPADTSGSNGPFMEQLPMHPVRRISHHAVEIQQKDYEYEKPSSAPIEPETIDSTTLPVRPHRVLGSSLVPSAVPVETSPVAALSRTLRKHFLASEEAIERRSLSQTANANSSDSRDRELEMSPMSQSSQFSPSRTVRNQLAGTLETCRKALDKTKNLMYPTRTSIVGHFADVPVPVTTIMAAADQNELVVTPKESPLTNPLLSLPQSILSKYGRPPASRNGGRDKLHQPKDFEISPFRTAEEQKITDISPRDEDKIEPVTAKSSVHESDSAYKVVTRTAAQDAFELSSMKNSALSAYDDILIDDSLGVAEDTTSRWAVHANNPIFDDEIECAMTMRQTIAGSQLFWEHPVRYLPKLSEKNLYRTIMIDHIPNGTSVQDVLSHIRGGMVESVQLLPAIGASTSFMTARIVFVYEAAAHGLRIRDSKHPIRINGSRVRVWPVLQPTYPRHPAVTEAICHGATRVLLILHISSTALKTLDYKLAPQRDAGFLVEERLSYDGYPVFEFTTIAEAVKAARIVETDPGLGGTAAAFDTDPCDEHNYTPVDE